MVSEPYGKRVSGVTVHLKQCLACGKLDVVHDAVLVEQRDGAVRVMYRSRAHQKKAKSGRALDRQCEDGWSIYADPAVRGLAQDEARPAPDEPILVTPAAGEKAGGQS